MNIKDFLSPWDADEIKLLREGRKRKTPETHEEIFRKLLDASK